MNPPEHFIFDWPQMPPLPTPGQIVLIRTDMNCPRPLARQESRIILRRVLAAWSGRLPEQLPLRETPRGPVWDGQLAGHPLEISLSYSANDAWIGLRRGGAIGIDAMALSPIAEAEAVARHYLGPVASMEIQQSENPPRAFALAWTRLEARLKCLKLNLTEWNESPYPVSETQIAQSIFWGGQKVVTVVTANGMGEG